MTDMKEKLIKDGSETRRTRMNLMIISIGAILLLMGIGCVLIKAASVEYIDAAGFLHENFFLLPMAALFILCGFLSFLTGGISRLEYSLEWGEL